MNLRDLNPPRTDPAFLITRSSAEFDDAMRRAAEGQFTVTVLESMRTRTGHNNAVWKLHVRWNEKGKGQATTA